MQLCIGLNIYNVALQKKSNLHVGTWLVILHLASPYLLILDVDLMTSQLSYGLSHQLRLNSASAAVHFTTISCRKICWYEHLKQRRQDLLYSVLPYKTIV